VGDYSVWPPEAARLPRLGGLFNPNLERIVALHPDLAVLIPSERELGVKLARLGIDVLAVESESIADVERSFATIARRCGVPAAGERLRAEWRAALAPASVVAAGGRPPRVLLSVTRRPGRITDALVAGPGTFYDELLRRLGGENAFADAPVHYPQASLEEVVARAPDVILELRGEPAPPDVVAVLRRDWQRLPDLPAVRAGRIEVVAGSFVVIPGPRLPLLYRALRAALARGVRPAGAPREAGAR
jgi:cobalamin transport system substrate-binding protein